MCCKIEVFVEPHTKVFSRFFGCKSGWRISWNDNRHAVMASRVIWDFLDICVLESRSGGSDGGGFRIGEMN
jgi:hypothetical protein